MTSPERTIPLLEITHRRFFLFLSLLSYSQEENKAAGLCGSALSNVQERFFSAGAGGVRVLVFGGG